MRSKTHPLAIATICVTAVAVAAAAALAAWLFSSGGGPSEADGTFRISGGSMANTLLGEHYEIICGDCRFAFACDAADLPRDSLAVCPNCGYPRNEISAEKFRPGDVVELHVSTDQDNRPKRWDVIAFNSPDDEQQQNVKRIVGLPGEQISIQRGDIYANGQIVVKSFDELRRVAVPVFDNRFRPTPTDTVKPRWRSATAPSKWQARDAGFVFADDTDRASHSTDFSDWLVYHHWPCMPSLLPRATPAPIKDNDGYNQGLSRQMHLVDDLMLTCDVRLVDWDRFVIKLHNRYGEFQMELARDEKIAQLSLDGNPVASCALPTEVMEDEVMEDIVTIEFAICDARAILAINHVERLVHPVGWPTTEVPASETPLAIAASGAIIEILNLRIDRDLHYLSANGLSRESIPQRTTGDAAYFVLGDNAPISIDSRRWKNPLVSENQIIGKVRLPVR